MNPIDAARARFNERDAWYLQKRFLASVCATFPTAPAYEPDVRRARPSLAHIVTNFRTPARIVIGWHRTLDRVSIDQAITHCAKHTRMGIVLIAPHESKQSVKEFRKQEVASVV